MTKQLRRLSVVVLLMFLSLFVATSWIQVAIAGQLAENPENRRTLYDSYEVQRGTIFAGSTAIASSQPSDDIYSWIRQYPDAEMWAPVTGFINPVLRSSTGLERAMNAALAGTGSQQFLTRLDQIVSGQPPRGSNVLLSLDPDVQKVAYDALDGLEGAVVAMEPDSGRILAMATSPSFDTNLLASHNSSEVNAADQQLRDDPLRPRTNRVTEETDPPGSTFKLVVAAAALASGEYTPDSTFDNPATFRLPGTDNILHNFDRGTCGPGEETTLETALRLSCNIPMAELALELGTDAIREQAQKFGFNSSFEIPLDVTASSYPEGFDEPQTALSGIGQTDVRATPLQMAMVAAGIANDGIVMNPRMVDRVVAADLAVQDEPADSQFGQALTPEQAETLTQMMVGNVQNGAASGARIEGVDVAGKTGTAEHNPGDPYTLWFTGFAPAEDPEVVVTVMVQDGGGLGQDGTSNGIAAPIAKRVIEAVLSE
ncbi:penicillin-binding protein 2 [Microbacterium sp. EYE_5]|uniref:peptidoglycan D,D-transpeptidase FtsI family protein n=1 Tax=unclassified Microbacterium TaxID=2609290 RepID=UPI002002EE21|nr:MULTISPECIES: penicillin-binding protein 2 [unclassified Microbacterium]MCK6079610.1 penicillin-binding protein 2 [Microbacterium sp. EYE_382]MCK6084881.1 penicillin-binding protein 2 [Microbacterium sp. EYE_384]MCK6122893.1 penicillin-binding protein 2 [Microbacterium sp. EYE_80]MCK6125644.1 penicillin-binding protein 2 [Microbacterium sp. EYE_79]MCK6140565.1 penicillin-binding protein 2 [Microbacterium sp. EYE_39]